MTTEHACTATFIFQGRTITHTMFVLHNLACKQKLLLGMDFMNDHGLTINIDRGTITFPDSQVNTITADVESMEDITALHCMQTVSRRVNNWTNTKARSRTDFRGRFNWLYLCASEVATWPDPVGRSTSSG